MEKKIMTDAASFFRAKQIYQYVHVVKMFHDFRFYLVASLYI